MSKDIEFATISIEEIEVDDRARKEMGDIKALAASIKESGLIQPLAVVRQDNGRPFRLLAGERRLEAKKLNGDSTTPVRIFPSGMSALERKSIELHENFYRKDFTWIELIMLQKEVHELQQQIHGKKVSTLPDAEGWSMADTAELLGRAKSSVSQDIELATAVSIAPDIFAECKTKNDAAKILKKMSETVIRQELARRVTTDGKGSNNLRKLSNSYVVGDFFDFAKQMDKGMFNIVEIDPPYAINLVDIKSQNDVASTQYDLKDYNEIDPLDYESFMRKMLGEAYRLASEHSWLILWFAPDPWFPLMNQWILDAGWETNMLPGIWTKGSGQSMNPNIRLANSYEMFFYAWKGSPALAKGGRINQFDFSPVPPQKKTHPTERPIELMQEIYSTFGFEGSRILIPCAGSGTGIIAADKVKMSAVATDINPAYKDGFIVKLGEYLNSN